MEKAKINSKVIPYNWNGHLLLIKFLVKINKLIRKGNFIMEFIRKSIILTISLILLLSPTAFADSSGLSNFPDPIDEETWVLPEDMTWDDYKPIPGINWNDPPVEPEKVIKGAIILVDFQDQEFIMSQPKGSDVAGNPVGEGDIPRDELSDYW